jgi:DNA mismatch endonuclease (patch repair protein)
MMSGIRSTNTRPELILRKGLHALGFRFRLHDRTLPGTPDLVFPKFRAVIFAHGCFWHGHDCHLFRWPSSRQEFWQKKISCNREVDRRAASDLALAGWRQCVVWECALKSRTRRPLEDVLAGCATWLRSDSLTLEIKGADGAGQAGRAAQP